MSTKTAELIGKELDYWVGRAVGYPARNRPNSDVAEILAPPAETRGIDYMWITFQPSENWNVGGPIIERKGIELQCRARGSRRRIGEWIAYGQFLPLWTGPTALVAAMRAVVASKYGGTVPIEE